MLKRFFLFLTGLFFLFSLPAYAQSTGYNIVNNFFNPDGSFNDKAFELIASNNSNPAVTVRLTSGELRLYPNLVSLIQGAAQRYGITNITWQPEDWSATTPEQFNNFWIGQLSQITMGQISLFVEYNYHYGNPANYAQILISALNAGFQVPIASTNFNTTNPSGTNPFGGQMIEYVEFLRQVQSSCASAGRAGCLNEIPVWSLVVYSHYNGSIDSAVDDFVNQFNSFRNNLKKQLGINLDGKRFIIPEVGLDPSLPIEQRLAIASDFITALEARVHGDAELSALIDSMTFLFMDDKTGKQYLLVKNADGEWVVLNYDDYGLVGLSGSPFGGENEEMGTSYGQSFIIEKNLCWGEDPNKVIKAAIASLEFNISQNDKVAENLRLTNSLLIPPERINKDKAEESEGEISFEVCDMNSGEWFNVEDSIKFSVPSSYMQASKNGSQVGSYFSPKGVFPKGVSSQSIQNSLASTALASNNNVLGDSSCPDIGFRAWGEGGNLCWQITGSTGDLSYCDWGYRILVNGGSVFEMPILGGAANCLLNPSGGSTITCHDGGASTVPFSGSGTVSLAITQHSGQDCRSEFARNITCTKQANGEIICTDASGNVIPTPTPPPCVPRNNDGEWLDSEKRDTAGVARIPVDHHLSIEEFLKEIAAGFGVCRKVKFLFTPVTNVPYTFPAERIQRSDIYQTFANPGTEDKYLYKDGETFDRFEVSASPGEEVDTFLDIFGQKGVKSSFDQTIDYLLSPK